SRRAWPKAYTTASSTIASEMRCAHCSRRSRVAATSQRTRASTAPTPSSTYTPRSTRLRRVSATTSVPARQAEDRVPHPHRVARRHLALLVRGERLVVHEGAVLRVQVRHVEPAAGGAEARVAAAHVAVAQREHARLGLAAED